MKRTLIVGFAVCLAWSWSVGERSDDPGSDAVASHAREVPSTFDGLPLSHRLPVAFIENHGQWDADAHFVVRAGGLSAALRSTGLSLDLALHRRANTEDELLARVATRGVLVSLDFEGARLSSGPRGEVRLPGVYTYFRGRTAEDWYQRVPSFASVVYEDLYEGISMRVRESARGDLEYDLLLEAWADVAQVVVRCAGQDGLRVDEDGWLVIETAMGPIVQQPPLTWEELGNGARREVACRYRLLGEDRYGFEVEGRAKHRPLVIDPGLRWSTYLGGSNIDTFRSMTLGLSGEIIVEGVTGSLDFPTIPGAYEETTLDGGAFLSRLSADGMTLLSSTYFEHSGLTAPHVGADGTLTIAGTTSSADFPATPGAYDETQSVGFFSAQDAVVVQLTAEADALLYATYLGSEHVETGFDAHVNDNGIITIVGKTCSDDFPTTPGSFDPTDNGGCDAFLVQLDPTQVGQQQLVSSSYLGGMYSDEARYLFALPNGELMVMGWVDDGTPDFPITPDAFTTEGRGFLTRWTSDLSTLLYGSHMLRFTDWAIAPSGAIVGAAGASAVPELITRGVYDETHDGGVDVLVCQFNSTGTELEWGTYVGSFFDERASGVAVDTDGNVIVTGTTSSPGYPTTPDAFDATYSQGLLDGIVLALSPDGTELVYSTYIGGASAVSTILLGVEAPEPGVAIVGGSAFATFPTTAGAYQEDYASGFTDVVLFKIPLGTTWRDLGGALAGTAGMPRLTGAGSLCLGEPLTLTLSRARANSSATLVVGLSELGAAFKSGTLVPHPDFLFFGLPVSATGQLEIASTWPAGIPSGFELILQYWISDPQGPVGFAASNGLLGTANAALSR